MLQISEKPAPLLFFYMEAGIIFKIALTGIRAAGSRFVHTDIHPVLKGEINAFSLQGGKINSFYDFQRFPALGDIHPDRLVIDYGKIEITDLGQVAASPVGRNIAVGIGSGKDFLINPVCFIETGVLLQAAAPFFPLEFQVNGGVRCIGIAGIEAVNAAVLKLDGPLPRYPLQKFCRDNGYARCRLSTPRRCSAYT